MKKLSEINEGFMTRSLDRNKSGEKRLEDNFWTDESIFEVLGYKGYYISPDPEGYFIDIYHKPNKEPLLSYKDLDYTTQDSCPIYLVGTWSEIANESNKLSTSDKNLFESGKFAKAVNKTIREIVPDDYYEMY